MSDVNLNEKTKVSSCPTCGGQMAFDPETGALKCGYCDSVKAIEMLKETVVENPFEAALKDGVREWNDDDIALIQCKNCGAQIVFDPHTKAQFCNYCGSSHVSVITAEKTIAPGYVIPFKVTDKKAGEAFKTWISKRWFAPNDLKTAYKNDKILGTYVPHWTFDTQTFNRYTAQRGDYYYVTKTRVVNGKTETYQERHTRWTNVSGNYERFFDDVLVTASKKVDNQIMSQVDSFDLHELITYKPDYLAGFFAERYSIALEEGWGIGKRVIDNQLENEITQRIGGDEVRMLNVATHYDDVTYKHILLPLWISSYLYKGKTYNFMVNGQNGTVKGTYPKSAVKIALAILAVVAVLVVAYVLISSNSANVNAY